MNKHQQTKDVLVFFKEKFIQPLDNAIITGVYGSQRILNGKPRWPHYGLDFAGDLGTPIKAMADGIVTLAEKDLYYTGATLIFDHGHGISTLYMHMDKIFVEKDDIVKVELFLCIKPHIRGVFCLWDDSYYIIIVLYTEC